ncbi:MAG: hypothetical protein ACREPB_15155 [Arenimonas sp.]
MRANTGNTLQASENRSGRCRNPMRMTVWGTAAFLLLLPLAAMQFTTEVDWTGSDFGVIGFMLLTACCTYEFAVWLSANVAYRAAFGIALIAAFMLVWINLAIGIIGDENNPPNLMFGGVLAVGFIGALIARFRPQGMSRALIATAIAQALVGVIAAVAGWGLEAAVLAVLFGAMWLTSAALFRKASR